MTLADELAVLRRVQARSVLAKELAANDNSKNQVYLGASFEAVQLLPTGPIQSDPERPDRLKAPVEFWWALDDGGRELAPDAQLILYPQYPEVRLSGFLRRTKHGPNAEMTSRENGRVLLLGIRDDGSIVGRVLAATSPAAAEFRVTKSQLQTKGIFHELPIDIARPSLDLLTKELARITARGWIRSWKLKPDGSRAPCESPQCGGYTLEAELGITPNGRAEPDFMGWEVKQYSVSDVCDPVASSPVTLMTPEPRGGLYAEDFSRFMSTYGYVDRLGRPDRMNFGGIYTIHKRHKVTGLRLELEGYDPRRSSKAFAPDGAVYLVDDRDRVAAQWPFADLLTHWSRKHAQAAYVPAERQDDPVRAYRFGSKVDIAEGTDFSMWLRAIADGFVYLDPGVKVVGAEAGQPKTKRRNQFRIKHAKLARLYRSYKVVDVASV